MREPHADDRAGTPHYTGIVCRACKAPVAEPRDEQTLHCPACGHTWHPGPPVLLNAA